MQKQQQQQSLLFADYPAVTVAIVFVVAASSPNSKKLLLSWLDWIFWSDTSQVLSINYIAVSKDMGKNYHNCII